MSTIATTTHNENVARRPEGTHAEATEDERTYAPLVDIFENAQELLLLADLPGVGKEDVKLHFEKDRLTLEAKAPNIRYRRQFVVSSGVDVEKTEATVREGVLSVKLPKAKALQSRQIKVLGA